MARASALGFEESRRLWFKEQRTRLGVTDAEGLATQLAILVDGAVAVPGHQRCAHWPPSTRSIRPIGPTALPVMASPP